MGGRTAPCLLAVALSSVLILIISRQLPCVCRVASRGSSAACMVTAILEVSVGNVCGSGYPEEMSCDSQQTKSGGVVE